MNGLVWHGEVLFLYEVALAQQWQKWNTAQILFSHKKNTRQPDLILDVKSFVSISSIFAIITVTSHEP